MQQTPLSQGNAALRNKDYEAAIRHYNRALAQHPELAAMLQSNIDLAYQRGCIPKPAKGAVPVATVDIVVPVYNALEDVKKCLESLQRCTDGLNVTVIVVNDGSDEATTQWLREYCNGKPVFKLIEHEKNAGYTKAVNTGLKATTADYAITQNSDTIVSPGWLTGLIRCMNSSPTIGIVGPLSNAASWQNVPDLRDEQGNFAVNDLPAGYTVEDMARVVQQASNRAYPRLPFVNGFCFMIKRQVIDTIGFMDEENFPLGYGEENDYCIRATNEGFDLAIADDIYVFHAKSKSFGHSKRKELSAIGNLKLLEKHTKPKLDQAIKAAQTCTLLEKVRTELSLILQKSNLDSEPAPFNSLEILFLLPVAGAGGGIHSVVQEVAQMRRIGVNANVAIRRNHLQTFKDSYSSQDVGEDIFVTYEDLQELEAISRHYDVLVATIYSSVKMVKDIVDRNPNVSAAYYIQDYEPLFFDKDSQQYKEAFKSYTLIDNAICFAKTDWLINEVMTKHNIGVQKVEPGLDHTIYFPKLKHKNNEVTLTAMIRPQTPRRGAERTVSILSRLKKEFGDKVSIEIFGSSKENKFFEQLKFDFPHINYGEITRESVAKILQRSDIFFDLSDYQAFGRTGLEAMACGSAVILTKFGGVDEYAIDNTNALVVDPFNENEVLTRARELINNRTRLLQMQRECLTTAARFDVRKASLSELFTISDTLRKQGKRNNFSKNVKVIITPALMGNGRPAGSGYVRLIDPYRNKSLDGFRIDLNISKILPEPGSAKIAIFQRDMGGFDLNKFALWSKEWRKAGGSIIYDIDDDMLDTAGIMSRTGRSEQEAMAVESRIKFFLQSADLVTVSMPSLADKVRDFSKKVIHLPNYLDEQRWWIASDRPSGPDCHKKNDGDPIRIGYIGTPTHDQDLAIVAQAIKRLEREYGQKISVEVIGAFERSPVLFGKKVSLPKATEYPNFVEWLGKRINWDIGIIPLLDDRFNRSKSYLKFIEYTALDIAIACSDVPTYHHIASHENNSLMVQNSPDEWYSAIKRLIEDRTLRIRLAAQAKTDLCAKFTIQKNSHLYMEALRSVLN